MLPSAYKRQSLTIHNDNLQVTVMQTETKKNILLMQIMNLKPFKNKDDSFQTKILDGKGKNIYTTDPFSSELDSNRQAEKWMFWFENAPLNKAESIYYILSVPDNWIGSGVSDNPYNGLQVKIGITKSLRKRIANLKTGSEGQLILHAIEPGDKNKEKEIHKKFGSDRRQGEWFICSRLLYKHIMDTWKRNILLPPEYQNAIIELYERIAIYKEIQKFGPFDMINPSINDEWGKTNFIDLVYSNIVKNKR